MSHYHHLSTMEREKIGELTRKGIGKRAIAKTLGRSPSTICRELRRNTPAKRKYYGCVAQRLYERRRKACGRKELLENQELLLLVKRLFFEYQFSPEEIANRLKLEKNRFKISYTTIYRGIREKKFDQFLSGEKKASRKLRHRGKKRKDRNFQEQRGKIQVDDTIADRPQSANSRRYFGHFEADTVNGKKGTACILTLNDRKSRYLIAGKVEKNNPYLIRDKLIELMSNVPQHPCRSITPDRGQAFRYHREVTAALGGVKLYFCDPHSPWQRGTNENSNGLLREYIPKGYNMDFLTSEHLASAVDKLNLRPRKCLGWRTPFEVFFCKLLHLT